MSDLAISVSNNTQDTWNRTMWDCGAGDDKSVNWTDKVTDTPSDTLAGLFSTTQAAADTEHLGSLVQDALFMTLGYQSAQTNDVFAVSIMRRFHMIGLGKGDVWRTYDGGVWSSWTENTSEKTWTFNTYTVVATPTLSDDAASVSITIRTPVAA